MNAAIDIGPVALGIRRQRRKPQMSSVWLGTLIALASVRANGVDHCLLSKVENHRSDLGIGNLVCWFLLSRAKARLAPWFIFGRARCGIMAMA